MQFVIDQNAIEAVALASIRILVFLVIAPPFAQQAIPTQVKTILSVALAVAIGPAVTHGYVAGSTGQFIVEVVIQAVAGGLLGFLVYAVYTAVEIAGSLLDQFGGFSMAQQYDPSTQIQGAQFARLFQMIALTLLFTSNAYQVVIEGVARSFTALPLTAGIAGLGVQQNLLTIVTQMMLAALQIAGPIAVVLFLVNVGLSLLTRVAPQLQAFSLGPPALALMTILMVSLGFTALPSVISSLTGQVSQMLGGVG
ncbi:flagellar biosynthetic protein FliR [Curtobacterium sp. MCBD17_040]|uniref:flagellar biosynthetic protein FliR n=1 Tax=Curtobacterium sp. MCBD17_040 TaxID=2175674 RepID=UPI000DAA4441|nr:flagellar biosynthetic protein FliR [Curtobacterium sp. MCBD17_040]WIB65591.1 flagellar biosynthetic protein FliR [Curtobacterium sp. MCBD17_040]